MVQEVSGVAQRDPVARYVRASNGADQPGRVSRKLFGMVHSVYKITKQLLAVDGKQSRRSHDRRNGKAAIHTVSAWARENGLVLGQVKVEEKSNEITAIPELLRILEISGC